MKISWLMLTYNRHNSVQKALRHNIENAGAEWHEMVWVDNGSSKEDRWRIKREIQNFGQQPVTVYCPTNRGVATGYNIAMAMASGTHMVITGCDMLMPKDWLKKMSSMFEVVPNMGIVTVYAAPIADTPERIRGEVETIGGLRVRRCLPIGRRMLSVKLQREIGYLHEGFNPYGWEDVAWAYRAEKICKEQGAPCYNLIDDLAEHLGTEGNVGYDHKDEHEYWRWKKEQVNDPKKKQLMDDLSRAGWPKYNPY